MEKLKLMVKANELISKWELEECDFGWISEVGRKIAEGITNSYMELNINCDFDEDDLSYLFNKIYVTALWVLSEENAKLVAKEILLWDICNGREECEEIIRQLD